MYQDNKKSFAKFFIIFASITLALFIVGNAIASAVNMESFSFFLAALFSNSMGTTEILCAIGIIIACATLINKDSVLGGKTLLTLSAILVLFAIFSPIAIYLRAIGYSVKNNVNGANYVGVSSIVLTTLQLANAIVFVILSKFFPIIIAEMKKVFGGKSNAAHGTKADSVVADEEDADEDVAEAEIVESESTPFDDESEQDNK